MKIHFNWRCLLGHDFVVVWKAIGVIPTDLNSGGNLSKMFCRRCGKIVIEAK